jgi:hypothetical protein
LRLLIQGQLIVSCAIIFFTLFAQGVSASTDVGELNRLIQPHLPQPLAEDNPPTDTFDISIALNQNEEPVVFSIPGFHSLGCANCHEGKSLHLKAAERMRRVLKRLKTIQPELTTIPLRQYIIQSWSDALLAPQQLAHATFDTIRISPAAILIDDKAYQEATHLHESLHLTQKFVGPVNELEAYGLNIISDPRFLILNFPYFEDVVKTFFIDDLSKILNDFYARPVREQFNIPRETQWFLSPFDAERLEQLRQVIEKMKPLLKEVTRLNREHSRETAYLSEQAGNPALLLEIVAAKHLPIPTPTVSPEIRKKAFELFELQMDKTDNTRLGYKVNRKKEALLFIQHSLKVTDPITRLTLYFEFLKKRFIKQEGEIILQVKEKEEFDNYIVSKIEGIQKMIDYKGLSKIEREAAQKLIGGTPSSP